MTDKELEEIETRLSATDLPRLIAEVRRLKSYAEDPAVKSWVDSMAGPRKPKRSFQCPKCGRIAFNENDVRERWCASCNEVTGPPEAS